MDFYNRFSDFVNKNKEKLIYKVQPKTRLCMFSKDGENFSGSCCVYFDFYFEGKLFSIGQFVEIKINHNGEEIIELKEKGGAFLTDKSSIDLNDDELEEITKTCIEPLFYSYVREKRIPFLYERILESISPVEFKQK